jgi:hypothetical protein
MEQVVEVAENIGGNSKWISGKSSGPLGKERGKRND